MSVDHVVSQLPAWMIFLLGVVWVISKAVVAAIDRRKEKKVQKIKRDYHSQSLPPPRPEVVKGKNLDDTGKHIIRELEAERTDRERLAEIHRHILSEDEWRGKMLAIESRQNELLRTILTEVRTNREQFDTLGKYYAAMLDEQAKTNELLRALLSLRSSGQPTTGRPRPEVVGDGRG